MNDLKPSMAVAVLLHDPLYCWMSGYYGMRSNGRGSLDGVSRVHGRLFKFVDLLL